MARIGSKTIKKQVLVPLTLTFLVLISTFIYSSFKIRQSDAESEVAHRYYGVQETFKELLSQRVGLMTSTIEFISRDEGLQIAARNGDRSALLEIAKPIFKQLSERYGITHFYFHDVQGRTFLRVHKPEKFGEYANRFTMAQAMETGALSYGLELGYLGTFTHRVVAPWVVNGTLLGYVELGEEIDQLLRKMNLISGTEFVVAIDKEYLDREQWESGMRMLGRDANWDFLVSQAIIDRTVDIIPHSLEKKRSFYELDSRLHTELMANNQKYRVKAFPLRDAGARRVGDFIVLLDVTKESSEFRIFILRITLVSLFLCSGLFAFAYGVLGRMDRRLASTQGQLYDEIDKATRINSQLGIEIGERNRVEQAMKKLNETLEQRVSERTCELEDLNREIEANRKELEQAYQALKTQQATILHQDKMVCVGQLAAGVAHDINNPIGFVSNNLSELKIHTQHLAGFIAVQDAALRALDLDGKMLEKVEEKRQELELDYVLGDISDIISESLEGTARVAKIVQNLRTFSRVDDTECKMADLKECLESTINITWNELRYKAEVTRNYGDIPPIMCYPGQLNQVFMNLLINAAHAIEGFGEINVRTWIEENRACVSIADTGCGIPEENLNRIFEPFFTTKDVGNGTGLGLSITYDIIKKHHGDISVVSKVGQGTTFVLRLPYDNSGAS
jgi:signal transduction histidine kinase